ncbi:MAG: hypothetical protein KGN84_23060 [Acidobacteriota bacterium]|nr:hypothetical protein [Acidobacteriota bacterium]
MDLEHRLEAYFATLKSSRRTPRPWQIYAAVTSSALALVTGASASVLANSGVLPLPQPYASAGAVHAAPAIQPGGVVAIYSTSNTIQPGEWISIYGTNLSSTTTAWQGDFPTSLGGVSVTINGKPAYLSYVSPGQINAQAPDDTASGTVPVVVTNGNGSATATVTLSTFSPSFSVIHSSGNTSYVAGIILRTDRSGAFGNGTYDILGPTGSLFGYRTVAARPGDTVEIYGVGFGPTDSPVPAGQAFNGAARIKMPFTLYINNVPVQPTFVGVSSAGLYQINLVVPQGLGEGLVSIEGLVGGMRTQASVQFSLEMNAYGGGGTYGSTGVGPGGSSFGPPWGSGGSGGGFSGGFSGGGSSGVAGKPKHHHRPKLTFPPK